MYTKLIEQYGTDLLSYRLRTARQKKRMQYKDFDKYLLKLGREKKALWLQKQALGWEPLVPPVQKGWKRFFVLREDVARGKHAVFFENILNKINTYDWSHRKDFKVRRRRFGRKIYVVKSQSLLRPYDYQFVRMGFSEMEKQFFHEVWEMGCGKQLVKRYVFIEPWRFVLRIRPNIIDKVRKRDAVIEQRLKHIRSYLERNCYQGRLSKLLYGDEYWRRDIGEKAKYRNALRNKPVHQILFELKEGLFDGKM